MSPFVSSSVGAAIVAAGSIAGELVARWWMRWRARYFVFPPGLRVRLRLDRHVLPQLEAETRFDVNSQGERGSELPKRSPHLYRVIVAGGSQTEGYFLDQWTSWPGALQLRLNAPAALATLGAASVHVGNIARSGVGSEALDLIFQRALPRYRRVQLILIMLGASDVMRWLEQRTPRMLESVQARDVFICHPEGPFGWKPGELAALELARRARRRWLRPVEQHEDAGRWIGQVRTMRAEATDIRSSVPDPAPMLEHFERHFSRALITARAHADRVIVIPQPWMNKPYTPDEAALMWHGGAGQVWRERVTTYYSFDVFNNLMQLVNMQAARIAAACDVELVDVMPCLENGTATYYDCAHFTPAGARRTAELIAAAILREQVPQSTIPLRAAG